MAGWTIIEDDLAGPEVAGLLRLHLEEMHQWSPPESVHAFDIDRLRQPDVTFYSVWDGDRLAAVGAIKALGDRCGELKSMRAHPDYRGKGAGKALLVHLLAVARERGYAWLGLETGTPEPFAPARGLYRAHGFSPCPPFADYVEDSFSQCMELRL